MLEPPSVTPFQRRVLKGMGTVLMLWGVFIGIAVTLWAWRTIWKEVFGE
jgi:hypothetical protein